MFADNNVRIGPVRKYVHQLAFITNGGVGALCIKKLVHLIEISIKSTNKLVLLVLFIAFCTNNLSAIIYINA